MRGVLLTSAAFLVLLAAAPLLAQDYRFSVPRTRMEVHVQQDASVRIVYDFEFENAPGAHAIDVVDVGTPTPGYHSVQARSGETSLADIRPSQYVEGFEVHMDAATIPAGGSGSLHIEFEVPELVFQDTTKDDNASLRITPTWFGSEFVVGDGTTELAIHLPPGVSPDDVLHHGQAFTGKALWEGHAVAAWTWNEPATREHLVGVSFPKSGMARVVTISRWELLDRWLRASPGVLIGLIGGSVILLGILFFRFTGGTGCCAFVPLAGGLLAFLAITPAFGFLTLPTLVALVIWNEKLLRRRKTKYLPAIAEVEGGGIKRGLTAPEAAVLLELPLAKVLGLVIFGLLKKGVLRREEDADLRVSLEPDYEVPVGEDAKAIRRAVAATKGTVLHEYEGAFLDVIQEDWKKPVKELDFTAATKALVAHAATRLAGFDLDETKSYYRHIVRRALHEARGIGDVEGRRQFLDKNLEWVLMDPDYADVMSHRGVHYWPRWQSAPAAPGAAPSRGSSGRPSFGDVAASFAGWAEGSMGSLASAIGPGGISAPKGAKGGWIDLSGIDKVSKSVLDALASSSGGSGGGGGGGCACACAGCACACACAGGGR